MMLYLASNARPDISFAVHQCVRFTQNTKVSHKTAVKRICRYLQGTKDNGLVFNPSKKLVVYCYADADFAGLWGHEDPQGPICARSRTGFLVIFANCPLLWLSKLQTEIDLSTLHSEYVALSHSVRALLPVNPIFERSRTGFVVTFANYPLLWVSKLQTEIALSTLHSEYVSLSHSVRALLPVKSLIK